MKALLTKRRIAAWVTIPTLLAGGVVMGTAVSASAHTGSLSVASSCVDGSYTLSFSGQTSNVPSYGAGHTATMTVGEIMPSGATITDVTVNNQATTLPATVVGNVPYSFKMTVPGTTTYAQATAFLRWGDGVTSDPIGKITLPGNCTKSVTPAAYTTTPESCTSNGSLSIPAQPTGVVVKVNGNVVNTPWSTSTPGTYSVVYSAARGYSLSSNPSGMAVVKAKLGADQCTPPVVVPPVPPQVIKPTASINATCVTRRYGEGVAQLNAGSTNARFLIKGAGKHKVVWVAAGSSKTVNLHGLKVGKVVKVINHHKVLAHDKVERRPVCTPAPPPHTGKRLTGAPA